MPPPRSRRRHLYVGGMRSLKLENHPRTSARGSSAMDSRCFTPLPVQPEVLRGSAETSPMPPLEAVAPLTTGDVFVMERTLKSVACRA